MNSKQFAWLYLIEHGFAGVIPLYYGGYGSTEKGLGEIVWDRKKLFERSDLYKSQIKDIGVDWDKTSAPDSKSYDVFNGSFADSKVTEKLEGTLILNDGTKQFWVADKLEVTNVFDMMATVNEAAEKFKEVFGG